MRCSRSTAFSCGRTGRTVLACEPSLSALSLAQALGPVLSFAFRLLASICAWLAMGAVSEGDGAGTERETRNGPFPQASYKLRLVRPQSWAISGLFSER